MSKTLTSFLALCALLLSPVFVQAQTVPGKADIAWTLPTTSVDGVPLTGANALTGVEVYVSTSPIADTSTMAPTVTLGGTATTASVTLQVTNGSTLYVRAKVVRGTEKSAFSMQASKLIQLSTVPNVPTSVTITLTINPAP